MEGGVCVCGTLSALRPQEHTPNPFICFSALVTGSQSAVRTDSLWREPHLKLRAPTDPFAGLG